MITHAGVRALLNIIADLELGYAEGPISTAEGGAFAAVYLSGEIDLGQISPSILESWQVFQEVRRKEKVLWLRVKPIRKAKELFVPRDPIPGDKIIIGKPSWGGYLPDLIRIETKYWWVRISSTKKGEGEFPWVFYRVLRNCPIVISMKKEDREEDLVLDKQIQWALEAKNWKRFLRGFDAF